MDPQNWWLVDVSTVPFGGIFWFQVSFRRCRTSRTSSKDCCFGLFWKQDCPHMSNLCGRCYVGGIILQWASGFLVRNDNLWTNLHHMIIYIYNFKMTVYLNGIHKHSLKSHQNCEPVVHEAEVITPAKTILSPRTSARIAEQPLKAWAPENQVENLSGDSVVKSSPKSQLSAVTLQDLCV